MIDYEDLLEQDEPIDPAEDYTNMESELLCRNRDEYCPGCTDCKGDPAEDYWRKGDDLFLDWKENQ